MMDFRTPQEAAVENVGPVDDGTESLGDAPSLSEEVAGTDKSTLVAKAVAKVKIRGCLDSCCWVSCVMTLCEICFRSCG